MDKIVMESSMNKENEYGQNGKYNDYEIKDAARTIADAEKIKQDKAKMVYVKKCLEKDKMAAEKAFKSIEDIENYRQKRALTQDT